MPESISELLALVVGLVVLCLAWGFLSRGEQLGWGRGRVLLRGHPVRVSTVNRPLRGSAHRND